MEQIKEELEKILGTLIPKSYSYLKEDKKGEEKSCDCVVYFSDSDTYKKLLVLENRARDILNIEKESRKKSLYNLVNLVNTNRPSYRNIKFKVKHKYMTISDKTKCMNRIPALFDIYKKTQLKRAKEYIKDFVYNKKHGDKILFELSAELEEKEIAMTEILNNSSDYDLLISTANRKLVYPHYYCNFIDNEKGGKKGSEDFYLRSEVPNVILYTPLENDDDNFRPSATVLQFIKEGSEIFDKVYCKKKK